MPLASQALLTAIALTAAIYDLRWRKIPNWLVLPGLILGIVSNTYLFGSAGLKTSLLGIGCALLVYLPLYALRGMGGGDVKLMAAIGAITGPIVWFAIFLVTAILGGLIAIVLLLIHGRLMRTLRNVKLILQKLARLEAPYVEPQLNVRSGQGLSLPHGAVIGIGTLTVLVAGRAIGRM